MQYAAWYSRLLSWFYQLNIPQRVDVIGSHDHSAEPGSGLCSPELQINFRSGSMGSETSICKKIHIQCGEVPQFGESINTVAYDQ